MSLSPERRKMFIDFISRHACDDIIIQVMNRVTNNLEDAKTLETYVKQANSVMPTLERTAAGDVQISRTKLAPVQEPEPEGEPEDLGPPCSKLGSNGQAIEFHLVKHREQYTVKQLSKDLKLSESKIKPMLALLIERGKVKRVGPTTYATTIGDKA